MGWGERKGGARPRALWRWLKGTSPPTPSIPAQPPDGATW